MNGSDIQKRIFKKMTPEQKLKAAMRLYWSARRLKAAWLRQQNPDWTEEQVQKQVTEIFRKVRPCLHKGLPAVIPTDYQPSLVDRSASRRPVAEVEPHL